MDKFSYSIGVSSPSILKEGQLPYRANFNKSLGITEPITASSELELEQKVHDYLYTNNSEYQQHWDDSMLAELDINLISTDKIRIGGVSCVGIGSTDFPLSHGNYFSINIPGVGDVGVINMWYENLIEAIKRFNPTVFNLEIFDGGGVIVTSPDIPNDWYIENLFMKYNCCLSKASKCKIRQLKNTVGFNGSKQ